MNEQKLEDIRSYYDNNDTSALMEDAERVDLGDVADPDATVAFTVSMPNRVLRGAREIAAAEGVSTNDVLRRFLEAGANALVESEASIPVSKLLRLIDEARGA
ncbi:hypothetical protein [Corynebacterium lujinxingii]|uniref:CopG family transcriptional regulator n=1 Tax=Corynebacterium lujinxingii TaxID=2763010 RepID=A0A7H0JZK8_9CORY|nr:hypothetical protein [Corynebacterium lujinxingii]MBC3179650.1 hypothetical protein [Corynebacterium lujinxingii]MCT1369961.1 hypothetical protein [Corynebacterium mucifaciens]NNO10341.1 hypothetical protein [Corynebacterium lujinxingii]QNP90474.1 hypothetical protein IAU68_01375 [Corynebacterium lujinxingii]